MTKCSIILTMTDIHIGKRTESYSPEVAQRRINEWVSTVRQRIAILRAHYEIEKLHVFLLGDVVDGANIYPSQPHHQADSNPDTQAMFAAETILKPVFEQLAEEAPVEIDVEPGNHGRTGKHAIEAANWDITCYRYLDLLFRGHSRITVNIATAAQFVKVVNVRGHGHLLYHGHEIRSFANIPWYGMMNRLLRWQNSSLPRWSTAHMGHFHSCGTWEINKFTMYSSGTMVTHDTWAFQVLGWESANNWWMLVSTDSEPVEIAFKIRTAEPVVMTGAPIQLSEPQARGGDELDEMMEYLG